MQWFTVPAPRRPFCELSTTESAFHCGRRIGEVTQVGAGRSRELDETVTDEETGNLALQMLNPVAAAVVPAAAPALFSTDDVAQVVGRPVVSEPATLK